MISVLSLVAPFDRLGAPEVVAALDLDAGDFLDDIDKLIDRNQLAAAQVDRSRSRSRLCRTSLKAVVMYMKDRSMSIAPDFDGRIAEAWPG